MMRKFRILSALMLSAIWLLVGCSAKTNPESARQPIDFTVTAQRELPEELLEIIEENKAGEIRMAYEDGEDLYLIRGYGEQKTGGYSIAVKECSEDETTIWLDTQLIGPKSEEELTKDPSYPFLAVKMERRDKEVNIQ